MNRSSSIWIAAICLLLLAGCSTVRQTPPMASLIAPMGPVPRLLSPEPAKPTAGDLFRLTLDLYEYAGECKRRLDAVTK